MKADLFNSDTCLPQRIPKCTVKNHLHHESSTIVWTKCCHQTTSVILKLPLNKHIRKHLPNGIRNTLSIHFWEFVKNLSNMSLASAELKLLQKGLNFNIPKKFLAPQEMVPPMESALKKLLLEKVNRIRIRIRNIINNQNWLRQTFRQANGRRWPH